MRLTPRMRTPTRLTGLSPAGPAGLLLAGLAGLLLATPTATQEAQAPRKAPPCAAPEHHQFDFWIGRWTVSNPQGQTVGSSHVSRISAGCAVLEQWQAADGPPGTSINFYEPQTGRWNQVWVGGGGMILRLVGTFHDGAMELDASAGPRGRTVPWSRSGSCRPTTASPGGPSSAGSTDRPGSVAPGSRRRWSSPTPPAPPPSPPAVPRW
jgi:hypothetical protein